MVKTIKNSLFTTLLVTTLIPNTLFAEIISDVDTSGGITSSCVTVNNNLSYKRRITNSRDDVVSLQSFLNDVGYLADSSVTGFFGKLTERAVAKFQSDNGLVATPPGFVGVGTRAKIHELSCAGQTVATGAQDETLFPLGCSSSFGYSVITGASCLSGRNTDVGVASNTSLPSNSSIQGSVPDIYGYYYLDYSASSNSLSDLVSYTNFGSAQSVEQVTLLVNKGFTNIMYVALISDSLAKLLVNEGVTVTTGINTTYDFRTIPDYENKILAIYKEDLIALKNKLITSGVLDKVTVFYIVDEPALHRNYIPNQAFLDNIDKTFKAVFPNKKSTIAFAEDPASSVSFPFRGAHLNPPSTLDVVIVDPYFFGKTHIGCSRSEVKKFLYVDNPNSTVGWAKQFGKPVYVATDAMLTNGSMLPECYYKQTYKILKDDSQVKGIIWFMYDASFIEGTLSGTANNPNLVNLIKGLTINPVVTLNNFSPSTIQAGQHATISFTSTYADSCTGNGIWNGDLGGTYTPAGGKSTSALYPSGMSAGTYTQTVTCTGTGGQATSVTRTLTVTAATTTAATTTLTAPEYFIGGVGGSSSHYIYATEKTNFAWRDVPGATSYKMKINTSVGNPMTGLSAAMNAQDLGITSYGTYTTSVQACNSAGSCGPWSNQQTLIYSAPVLSAPAIIINKDNSLLPLNSNGSISTNQTLKFQPVFIGTNATQYYLTVNGQEKGPFTGEQVYSNLTNAGFVPGTYTIGVKGCSPTLGCTSYSNVGSFTVVAVVQFPSVTLSDFSPTTIQAGQTSTISFTSTNASSCTGVGIWGGDLGGTYTPVGGKTTPVMNTPGTYTQTITCSGNGMQSIPVTKTLTVTAAATSIVPVTTSLPYLYSSNGSAITGTSNSLPSSGSITVRSANLFSPSATSYKIRITMDNNAPVEKYAGSDFSDNTPMPFTAAGFLSGHTYKIEAAGCTTTCGAYGNPVTFTVSGSVSAAKQPSYVLGASTMCVDLPSNMHRGAESNNVKNLQLFLISKGLFTESVTGFYGDSTVSAVRDYQLSKDLPITGMVYDFTRQAIKVDSCK